MNSDLLAIPKGMIVKKPTRKPDMVSARGVPYWFGPNWVRLSGKTCGRILPVTDDYGNVSLYMLSKDGNLSYILGRIQIAFQTWKDAPGREVIPWREDMEVDCILLGIDPADILLSDWEYEEK